MILEKSLTSEYKCHNLPTSLLCIIKYSNKVIPDYGLCISFYDFIRIEPGKIYPGDGASHNEGNMNE